MAADDEDSRQTLKGIAGVYVLVEGLGPDEEQDGLSENRIRADVELKLSMTGIKVLTREESFNAPGKPYLYVNLNAMKISGISNYVYSVRIELNQDVWLDRDPKVRVSAVTWDVGNVGTVGTSRIDTIRDKIAYLVDMFINAWLAANPARGIGV